MFKKKKKIVKTTLNIDTREEITCVSTLMQTTSRSYQQKKMSKKTINTPVKNNEPEVFKWCACHIKRSDRGQRPDRCYDSCSTLFDTDYFTTSQNSYRNLSECCSKTRTRNRTRACTLKD
jgi:hypothetical protein